MVALSLGLFGAPVSLPLAVAGCGSGGRSLCIEYRNSEKGQFAEIVVGHFAAAVFVFFRYSNAASSRSCWTTGPWVRGRVDKRRDGDGSGRRVTTSSY